MLNFLRYLYSSIGKNFLKLGTKEYSDFCKEVREITRKGTENSVKKNFFVDFARMKFLERYGKNGELIEEGEKRRPIKEVRISEKGIRLVEGNHNEREKIYSEGIRCLCKPIFHIFFDTMRDLENYLKIEEYAFFLSFVGKELEEVEYDIEKIKKFILE